jgi:hypothetical protein
MRDDGLQAEELQQVQRVINVRGDCEIRKFHQ